mmetsp:Transcript_6961/g.42600  ORF Transcript_6961/g.42600 Transcript_6961/m.42600 type:complete len:230 (-) Transcript_6961:1625-2314(-)
MHIPFLCTFQPHPPTRCLAMATAANDACSILHELHAHTSSRIHHAFPPRVHCIRSLGWWWWSVPLTSTHDAAKDDLGRAPGAAARAHGAGVCFAKTKRDIGRARRAVRRGDVELRRKPRRKTVPKRMRIFAADGPGKGGGGGRERIFGRRSRRGGGCRHRGGIAHWTSVGETNGCRTSQEDVDDAVWENTSCAHRNGHRGAQIGGPRHGHCTLCEDLRGNHRVPHGRAQ